MAITHGMNVEQVQQLGNTLKQKAEQINSIITEINSVLGSTAWEGPDAQAFKGDQWQDHQAKLSAIAQSLDGFGQSAINNAQEQADVSGR